MTRLVVSRRFFLRFRHHQERRSAPIMILSFAFSNSTIEQRVCCHEQRTVPLRSPGSPVSTGETRSTTGNDCRVDIGCNGTRRM